MLSAFMETNETYLPFYGIQLKRILVKDAAAFHLKGKRVKLSCPPITTRS